MSVPESMPSIRVRGARVHNLRDIDVDVPRDRLVALTGVSGSGKSSLAFETIHAEGQRRYIDGLSTFARQFLDQLEPPDVDSVDGLPPTVSIDQRSGSASRRSTVGTLTEIQDYLRLLFARAGLPHCPGCGEPIRRQTPEQMVQAVMALGEGTKVIVLAPLVRGRKGAHADAFAAIRREGLLRARVDGETVELGEEPPKLAKTKVHSIEAVIDRLIVRDGMRARLGESLDRALKLGDGSVILAEERAGGWVDRILSVKFACPNCAVGFEELEPRTFSFNSPYGACPTCDGLGTVRRFDLDLVIPDLSRSLAGGAVVVPDTGVLQELAHDAGVDPSQPVAAWPKDRLATFFTSLAEAFGREGASTRRERQVDEFRTEVPCPTCGGARLRSEALAVTLGGRSIHEISTLAASNAIVFFESLTFDASLDGVGPPLVREVVARLRFLQRVGLDYLTLDRGAATLSGGELQRVRLAAQIGSGLVGVCYVLDEPTSGLHPRDTDRLLGSLKLLRDAGNTVLVVEHDESLIRAADWVIDLGPGAGPDGGRLVAEGPPAALLDVEASVTGRFLHAASEPPNGTTERMMRSASALVVEGATEHNLRRVDARFPVGCLTSVTGVSGSGKSTLVMDVLARAVRRKLGLGGARPGAYATLRGVEAIQSVVDVDQSPIGRSPRSTPATFVGVFDEIRALFARTREAKIRGYKAARFSFNARGGRCESCLGMGARKIEMQFLPDLYVTCEACRGLRYNRTTLEVPYRGVSIGDVLQLRVDAALEVFDAIPRVKRGLAALHRSGLGYVTLGQSSTTLSGGESQRVKLAAGLNRVQSTGALYILEEPTTGLHSADVANLLVVLAELADRGCTVIVIEHNLDVIRASDWVIDLGPGGGPDGGNLVATGTPAQVAADPNSITGRYLSANSKRGNEIDVV